MVDLSCRTIYSKVNVCGFVKKEKILGLYEYDMYGNTLDENKSNHKTFVEG